MKDPAEALRIATVNALQAGNISYTIVVGGTPVTYADVPIFDEFTEDNTSFPRIIIQDAQVGPQQGSKIGFRANCTQVIKVTMAFPGSGGVTKNITDNISSQIMQLLVPSPQGPFMDLGPDFKIMLAVVAGAVNQSYQDAERKYIDRNVRITYTIEQLNT